MFDHVLNMERYFESSVDLDQRIRLAHEATRAFGMDALVYDFTPVKFTHTGAVATPSFCRMIDVPDDMTAVWCESGFYQIDPVQELAFRSTAPFVWSYRGDGGTKLNRVLGSRHEPVTAYIRSSGIDCGISVPIHQPDGACAVVTAICHDAPAEFEAEANAAMAEFALFANVFHSAAYALFETAELAARPIELTPRERQCVRLAADGLSSKRIAYKLRRSEATVAMHLNAAARKLSASNRAQMIARAAHYRYLD